MSFSQKEGVVLIHVDDGPNAGQDFEIVSREKDSFDPGWKTTYGKGAGVIVYVAEGVSEPKLSFDCSSAQEVAVKVVGAAVYSMGGIMRKANCTIHHTFRRIGSNQTLSYRFKGCKLSGGGGYDGDDSGVKGKMEWMMTEAQLSTNSGPYTRIT
jgi:hypothetical protein